ncbi:RNA-directed DNA polymerase, eukaryota [Tanacetum coccineum]
MQALKIAIKAWSKEANKRSNDRKINIQQNLTEVDKLIDQGKSNDEILIKRITLLNDLQELNNRNAMEISQKAKIRWSIEGDENSKYFHGIMNKKRSQLAIRGTLANGEWISEPHRVKNEFFTHFKKQFSPIQAPSICFDFTFPTRLSSDQVQDLERPVTYEEVKRAVWDCGTNKSPGPDGFSFEFYRKYWTTIDDDVFQAVRDFFVNGHFPRGCNSSFIALIPKIQDAKFVKDFRPISLIGSVYKIIAKILANRLCLVLPYLISDVQSAFVANRQILDGPFILNELLSWCKFKKLNGMIFKVDFEKAFDSVKWDYLDETLKAFGFGLKWRNWISSCLNNAMGSVLVNGSPTLEFQFHKGLKQGDPISPFLFILIMETLHLTFKRVLNAGLYKGISLNDSFTISHLFYADDVVFIGEWNNNNIQTLLSVLRCFYLASGLKINLHKSKLMGIGVSSNVVAAAASLIGCSILTAPFNYLGVKVGSNMSRINSWDDVISKVSSRLSKWKLKLLSIGGRLTLLKSVLTSIPLYHMSIFKVPIGVLNHLESIRRNFFYGVDGSDRKLAWIGWNMVLTSKKNGGLGVSSFFAHNRALLFKWVWRFLTDGSSLWTRFIKAIFGNKGALDTHKLIPRRSPWQDVILAIHSLQSKGINLMDFIQKKVGNGENTSFWDDSWLGEVALKVLYKRLYALEMCKSISVAEKMGHPSLSHSFRRMPRGGVEQENYGLLCSKVADLVLPNISDRWCWSLEGSQEFSVKSSRILIDNTILPKAEVPTRWLRVVPIKVNVHAWRVCLDKLPTRANLSLRGMDIPSIACPLCNSAVESTSHIFFACPLARQVWRNFLIWWELEDVAFNSYNEWLNWIVNIRLHKQLKVFLEGKPPADKLLINSQISKSWFSPKVDVQKSLSKPVTTQSLPKNEKDQLLKRIAYLESKLASQDIRSCQKEYHELRTSYNALKVKFDSLNRQKWNINVSKSSKLKESVSEKVHTEMLSMQNKNDFASTINKKGRVSNETNFQDVSSNDINKWKSSSSTRFKTPFETPSFKNQWNIKRNFKSPLIPRELFSNETPVSSPRWNSTSLHRLDTTFNWFSKFGKPVSTVLKWVPKVVV